MLIYKEQGQTYQGDQHNDESPPKLEQVFEQSPLVRFSMLHYAGPLYRIWEMLVVFLSDLSVFPLPQSDKKREPNFLRLVLLLWPSISHFRFEDILSSNIIK